VEERFSTGRVESTVDQMISKRFCKRQQMAQPPRDEAQRVVRPDRAAADGPALRSIERACLGRMDGLRLAAWRRGAAYTLNR
jgi:hypothetical protein